MQTSGDIRFPDPVNVPIHVYEGLSVSAIMLGRVIENLDCPSETYYDSEVASLLEGDVWGVGSTGQFLHLYGLIPSFKYSTKAGETGEVRRSLTTEGIKTYRSMLSIKDTVPEFLKSSEKRHLARWVSQRKAGKAAYIITGYQTYTNAIVIDEFVHRRKEQLLGRLLLKIPAFRERASLEAEGKCSYHYEVTMNL